MLDKYAVDFVALGRQVQLVQHAFREHEANPAGAAMAEGHALFIRGCVGAMLTHCTALDMPVSVALLNESEADPPRTSREWANLVTAMNCELQSKQFFFVPPDRATFYDRPLPPQIGETFGSVAPELRLAGDAFAFGMYTACVFHAMRAAELGAQALAKELGVTLSHDISFADWGTLLRGIDGKIEHARQAPRGEARESATVFYAEVGSQLRYFKDGWRVRAAHARATFTEREAREIFEATVRFFEVTSDRWREPGP